MVEGLLQLAGLGAWEYCFAFGLGLTTPVNILVFQQLIPPEGVSCVVS